MVDRWMCILCSCSYVIFVTYSLTYACPMAFFSPLCCVVMNHFPFCTSGFRSFSHLLYIISFLFLFFSFLFSSGLHPPNALFYSYPHPNSTLAPFQQFCGVFVSQPRVPESGQPHPLGRPGDAGWHWLGGQGKCGVRHQCHQSSAGWSKGRHSADGGNVADSVFYVLLWCCDWRSRWSGLSCLSTNRNWWSWP